METTLKHKADTSKVQVGDVFSRFSCGKVTQVSFNGFTLKNTDGLEWDISKSIVENEFAFASHTEGEPEVINRTTMIELVKQYPRVAMSITFTKKPDPKHTATLLAEGKAGKTDRQWNSLVKSAMQGEERVMQGVHHREFDEHGRLRFTEIDGNGGMSGHRLVDLRTITGLIFHNQEYKVK